MKFPVVMVLVIILTACSTTGTPTPEEQASVALGQKSVVLLRIECTTRNESYEPFGNTVIDDNISLGVGGFDSGGEPVRATSQRFLSPESRREGWTYLLLAPGTYYLAVYPPRRTNVFAYERSLINAPRWRLDVPANAKLVYAGTLHLTGESEPLLFGGRIMSTLDNDRIIIGNDQALAGKLLAESFPMLGEVKTVLLQRLGGEPIILHAPVPASAK